MVSKNKHASIWYRKPVLWIAFLALIAALGSGVFWHIQKDRNDSTLVGIAGVSKINYGPPTKQEQQSGTTQKQEDIQRQTLNSQGTPTTADVFITSASYNSTANAVEIRAYISNLFEDGGTCSATLTNGSQTVTQTSSATEVATTTQCGTITIPRSSFSTGGIWQITLTYTSSAATGSQSTTVTL